ncbi:MAG: RlmE family RNA methyltransferase [Hyphomonadaceae bacterium]|nr:RlmE family RNA methyltransferase [Hyphomonadaceae bacterium]
MSGDDKRRWTGKGKSGEGARQLTAHVKNKRIKESSKKWIERQLNDPYVARAKAEGARARAYYKLVELDEKFHFLKRGARVIDLGAAPGGWAQVCVQRGCTVVGIDLLPIEPLAGAVFLQMDFLAPEAPGALMRALGGAPDIVLSDMAANTTGHAKTDQIRTGALAEAAADFAIAHVAPGGTFVTKAFQGGLDAALLQRLKQAFAKVSHAKPPASRAESAEVYVVAMGRKASVGE